MNRLLLSDWQAIRSLVNSVLCKCDSPRYPKDNYGKIKGNICQECGKRVNQGLRLKLNEAVVEKENRDKLNTHFRKQRELIEARKKARG